MSTPHEPRVGEIMTRDVLAVYPTTSLAALIELFLTHDIAGAPVVEENGHPVGIVTCTDLLDPSRRSTRKGEPRYLRLWLGQVCAMGIEQEASQPGTGPVVGIVEDVMTREVLGVDRMVTVREASRLMARAGIHRLVVTDGERACGVVTAMDCLKALTRKA